MFDEIRDTLGQLGTRIPGLASGVRGARNALDCVLQTLDGSAESQQTAHAAFSNLVQALEKDLGNPGSDQLFIGNGRIIDQLSGDLVAHYYTSKADKAWIEDWVVYNESVFVEMKEKLLIEHEGDYDHKFDGADAEILDAKAVGTDTWRATMVSRYYAPPSTSDINNVSTTLTGTEYVGTDQDDNVVAHLHRATIYTSGEYHMADAWILDDGYVFPNASKATLTIEKVKEGKLLKDFFLETQANADLYFAATYRVAKQQ